MDPKQSFDAYWKSRSCCILNENWHFASKMVKRCEKAGLCNKLYIGYELISCLIGFRFGGSEILEPSPNQAWILGGLRCTNTQTFWKCIISILKTERGL